MKTINESHQKALTFMIIIAICLMSEMIQCTQQIPPLSEDILQKIFHKNYVIVVYVCQQKNPNHYEHFQDYCADHPCAILEVTSFLSKKTNSNHQMIRNFVGHPDSEYFAILDAPRQLKYVLEVKEKTIKYKDIYNFQADFTSQKLEPFFSSEEVPTEIFEPCRQLVGKNFDEFLALKAPIKVVYLYTEQESCEICGEMLRGFADIAEKLYRDDVVAFGYFEIFKNDHKKIHSEIAPYFLVFHEGQEEPYGIEGEKFPQLENAIINIIAQHIYPGYKDRQAHSDEIDPEELVEHDIQELQINVREQKVGTNYDL